MPQIKYLETKDRAGFLQLMAYIGYAIAPQRFRHHKIPPVIAISGPTGTGKSLAAEAILKSWMDRYSHAEATNIAPDDKMFLESHPSAAAMNTATLREHVNGTPLTLAFNSCWLDEASEIKFLLSTYFRSTSERGALIVSNLYRSAYLHQPRSLVWMEINMEAPTSASNLFDRRISITAYNEKLLSSPQFKAYWDRIEDVFGPCAPASTTTANNPINRVLQLT